MKKWFLNLPLSKKLIYVLLITGLLPVTIAATISIQASKSEITQQAFNQLSAVREIKAEAIKRYFKRVENQLIVMAESNSVIDAMSAFNRSFFTIQESEGFNTERISRQKGVLRAYYTKDFGKKYQEINNGRSVNINPLLTILPNEAVIAQYMYIHANKNPLGEKHLLDKAEGQADYHNDHARYHPSIRTFLEKFGFYDIFLVDIETGTIVYSVFKELDYGTSLIDGPYADTNFGEAFREAKNLDKGQVSLKDYKPYRPSYDSPASFIATPIFNSGEKTGVLIFQMPLEPINDIMGSRAGMGETGESYLVGSDSLMRSDSILRPDSHSVANSFRQPETGAVKTRATTDAFAGKSDTKVIKSVSGNQVLSSYGQIDLEHFSWAAIAEIDTQEAFTGISTITWSIITFAIFGSIAIAAFAYFISKLIASPILELSREIKDVEASGQFNRTLDNNNHDEIGETSRAFSNLLTNLNKAITDTNNVLASLGQGKFEASAETHFPGQLGTLTSGANVARDKVKNATEEQEKQSQLADQKAIEAQQAAEQAEEQAKQTLIIKQALDVSATAVMITDSDFNINYQNNSSDTLMKLREKELQKQIAHFNANELLGKNIDLFHTDTGLQNSLLSTLQENHITQITVAGLTFKLSATPIKDLNNQLLGMVIEWLDLTDSIKKSEQEARIANENSRIRQALDSSSTCTMIADSEHHIIYANNSLKHMMHDASNDFATEFNQVNADNIVGQHINIFNTHSVLQEATINQLTQSVSADIEVGSHILSITTSPINNKKMERIGTVIEWSDKTAEVGIAKEIDSIIESASRGNFSTRVDLQDKHGFYKSMSEGLNNLLHTTDIALQDVLRIFSALARGDLSQKVEREYEGEFKQLKDDANNTVEKLRDIMAKIGESSTYIARAANEISDGNAALSQRTEQQASSLEQTASSMEEMTSIVKQSEQNATSANQVAARSVEIARAGNKSVIDTSAAMAGISEASAKIANIIGVIDEIAFQTNLLALNAAVEAARAGEQGRGFAVVAGEVRNLAQRSAQAAKEIKGLIEDSVDRVKDGMELVKTSESALVSIVSEIEQVGSRMEDLLNSTREQSLGISQVSTAVVNMDQMTQENAALVEQASAASEAMAEQAHSLDQLVSFFK